MTRDELRGELQTLFRGHFDDASIALTDQTTPADVKSWDSLSHISLMWALEKRFKISLTVREFASLKSVGQIVDMVQSKTGAGL